MLKKDKPSAVVKIRNRKGLHARASAKFVKCAESFDATVRVIRDGHVVGGTSIMGLMMLAASLGAEITLEAEGPEGPEAIEALVALVESGLRRRVLRVARSATHASVKQIAGPEVSAGVACRCWFR